MSEFRAPSDAEVAEAMRRIATPQLRRVFFERLRNPLWLEPLAQLGLFKTPPEPTTASDGTVREAYWPEIDYLVRVAPMRPTQAVDVLLQMDATENSWVRRAVFTIGASIPAEQAARLKPLLKSWLASGFGWRTDPREMVRFATNLLGGGEIKAGRWVANVLFRPSAEPSQGEPAAALDEYWYVNGLPRVVEALGPDGLRVVLRWLVEYERLHGNLTDTYDMTAWTREAVRTANPDSIGGRRSVEQALIEGVRDLAVVAARRSPTDVTATLLSSGMVLGRKLAIYAVAKALEVPDLDSGEVDALMAVAGGLLWDPSSRDDACRIEFGELARAVAARSSDALEPLEGFLAEGPRVGLDELRERLDRDPEVEPGGLDERVADYLDRWKHQWLSAVGREALPPQLLGAMDELDSRLGVIDSPLEPTSRITSWVGPTSPLSQDEMSAKSPNELIAHLASWHDGGDGWGPAPSHEGQGRELTALLTTNPLALSGAGALVGRLRPTYVSAALRGWDGAFRAGLSLDWDQVTEVIRDVLNHSDESEFPVEGRRDWDDEADYRYAKRVAVDLLESLVGAQDRPEVPESYMTEFADLLIGPANDDAAWQEYIEGSRGSGMDPLTLSINWQWPIRTRGLLKLMFHGRDAPWYQRAQEALERELERDDPPAASAAAIGEGLGRLLNVDREWIQPRIPAIFGGESALTRSQQVALTTAMAVHYYHPELYRALSRSMIAAIALGDALVPGWRGNSQPLERLGEWVVEGIIRGDFLADDAVAASFFANTSPEVRGRALGHVAWKFFHADAVDPDIRDRFAELWDARFEHVRRNPNDALELNDFHWVVKCGKFATAWWLPRLKEAVELDPQLARERYMIGKEVALASESDPAGALDALRVLSAGSGDSTIPALDLTQNTVPLIIARAIVAGDERLKSEAIAFMNALGEQGYVGLEGEVQAVLDGSIGQADVSDP